MREITFDPSAQTEPEMIDRVISDWKRTARGLKRRVAVAVLGALIAIGISLLNGYDIVWPWFWTLGLYLLIELLGIITRAVITLLEVLGAFHRFIEEIRFDTGELYLSTTEHKGSRHRATKISDNPRSRFGWSP